MTKLIVLWKEQFYNHYALQNIASYDMIKKTAS